MRVTLSTKSLVLVQSHPAGNMQSPRSLVLGSGLFGKKIAANLKGTVFVTSRSAEKAVQRAKSLGTDVRGVQMRDNNELSTILKKYGPFTTVINTCGPWNDENYQLARTTLQSKTNYIDISDSADHHGGFVAALDEEASQNKVIAVTGASTCPALSMAVTRALVPDMNALRSVRICVSGAFATEFGLGTMQSVAGYAGKKYQRLENKNEDTTALGWRELELHGFRGVPEKRLLANVITPELNILNAKAFPKLCSARVKAGVGHFCGPLALFGLSFMPRSFMESNFFANVFIPKITLCHHQLTHIARGSSNTIGLMKVSALHSDSEGSPIVSEWTLHARDNSGINVPCTPAVLLAEKMAEDKMKVEPGAYDFGSPGLLSLHEIEAYLAKHWSDCISTSVHMRPFESPFVRAIGSREAKQVDDWLFRSHASGGVFDGDLEVISPSFGTNPLLKALCVFAGMPPTSNGDRLPVHVDIEPVPSRNPSSGSDEIWFKRSFAARSFVSSWRLAANGVIKESFRLDQNFGVDVRPDSERRGFYLDGRALFPIPLQRNGGMFRLTFDSICYLTDRDTKKMYLNVGAYFPLLQKRDRFFGYEGDLHIKELWFPSKLSDDK